MLSRSIVVMLALGKLADLSGLCLGLPKATKYMSQNCFKQGLLWAQFEVYKDDARLFRWWLRAADSSLIAESCQGYFNRGGCENAVALVRNEAARASIILNDA